MERSSRPSTADRNSTGITGPSPTATDATGGSTGLGGPTAGLGAGRALPRSAGGRRGRRSAPRRGRRGPPGLRRGDGDRGGGGGRRRWGRRRLLGKVDEPAGDQQP